MNILDFEKKSQKPTRDSHHSSQPYQNSKNFRQRSLPTNDNQSDNPTSSKIKPIQKKLKQRPSLLSQFIQYPFKPSQLPKQKQSQKQQQPPPPIQDKIIHQKKHNVLFEFYQFTSSKSSLNTPLEMPKPRNIFDKNIRRNSKDQICIQQSINMMNKKSDTTNTKALIATQAFTNLSSNSQNQQGPRLMLSRYGAHRRLQAQKQQQNLHSISHQHPEKLELQPPHEKQKSPTSYLKPPPAEHPPPIKKPQSPTSSSQPPQLKSQFQTHTLTKNPNSQSYPTLNTQPSKKLTRNSAKPQLNIKDNKKLQENHTPSTIYHKKSPLFLYAVKNIFYAKMRQIFQKIKCQSTSHYIKIHKYGTIFSFKIRTIFTIIINNFYTTSFTKLKKITQPHFKKSQKLQTISLVKKNKKIIISYLHRIFIKKISNTFNKIIIYKKKYSFQSKIIYVLQQLFNRKIGEYFHLFQENCHYYYINKCHLIGRMAIIIKEYQCKIYWTTFSKLKSLKKPKQTTKQLEPTYTSPQLTKLQNQFQQNTEKLSTILKAGQRQKSQYLQKLQKAKIYHEQLSQKNTQKKALYLQLKQKIQSLLLPQENYIQQNDPIIDTKFPILYQLYIKIQKSTISHIAIDDLIHSFQFLQQQIKTDQLVNNWLQILQNTTKKQQISLYQGCQQKQRKAAKIAHQQQLVLIDMIRGYIKQKYMWELVKNALSSANALP